MSFIEIPMLDESGNGKLFTRTVVYLEPDGNLKRGPDIIVRYKETRLSKFSSPTTSHIYNFTILFGRSHDLIEHSGLVLCRKEDFPVYWNHNPRSGEQVIITFKPMNTEATSD